MPSCPKCDSGPGTSWRAQHPSSHWQDLQCVKINHCTRPTPTCSLDITLYKASTSAFCCLQACEQILAPMLPLALTPPASSTPQPPPVFLCAWSHMTQQNPGPGARLPGAFFPKRGGEDWLCGRDLERYPRLGSNCSTCQTWWILAKNKSNKGPLTGGWMNSAVLLLLTEKPHRAASPGPRKTSMACMAQRALCFTNKTSPFPCVAGKIQRRSRANARWAKCVGIPALSPLLPRPTHIPPPHS